MTMSATTEKGSEPTARSCPSLSFLRGRFASPPRRRRLGPGRPISNGWLLGPIVLLMLWSLASSTGMMDPRTFPAPWTVIVTAGDLIADGRLQQNLLTSAERVGQGLVWGIVSGLFLAIVAG